jgi:hypothetical protein
MNLDLPLVAKTDHVSIIPVAILILIALSVTNVYRAKTQSITCDEAYSYQLWTSRPWAHTLDPSDASNHVLQTLLSKASVATFGLSEFALRLPTLLAGFLYFVAVYGLSRLVFGQGGLFLLSVCVLSLNPLLLDLLTAARGYGIALAFCAWALLYLVQGPAQTPSQLLRPAILLALSVSSNITFLLIDTGLAALVVCVLLAASETHKEMRRTSFQALMYFIIPGILVTLSIVGGPMRNTQRTDFYFGLPSLARSEASLIRISFIHRITLIGIRHYYDSLDRIVDFISAWFVPFILFLSGFVWFVSVAAGIRKKTFLKQPHDRFLFFCAGALLFSVAASYTSHQATGLLYPVMRTGLPWIVFFLLTCLGLAKKFQGGRAALRIIQWPVLLFLLVCALWFAFEFNTNQYTEWGNGPNSPKALLHAKRRGTL